MRCIETPWEKRNLNVNGIEYYFEEDDLAEDIGDKVLKDNIHDYQVVHLPVNKMDIHNKLNENGFIFSEVKFELKVNLENFELPTVLKRYTNYFSYYKIDDNNELEKVFDAIKKGVFDTDKVALDPFLGLQKSGNRYVMWSKQIIEEGIGIPYMVRYENNNIGFFILKKISNTIGDSFLAALFNNKKYNGFGFSVFYYPMLEAKKMGMKKMITGVSSNNSASLKLHLALGYQIKNLYYVMTKHNGKIKE